MITLSEENKKILLNVFSKNLTLYRKTMKISQEEFGSLIGITRQTVSSIERGAYTLTWSIFLSCLLICSNNTQARQMIINTFAGDDVLTAYLESMMSVPAKHTGYSFARNARQLDSISCVITDTPGFPVVECDDKMTEVIGGIPENGLNFLSIIAKEDREIVNSVLTEKIRKQMFVCLECHIINGDGEKILVNCIIRRQKKLMKDGRFDVVITGYSGEALRKHTISDMMDVIPTGLVVYEVRRAGEEVLTDMYYANQAFYDVIGHTKEQFASIHNNNFKNLVASDDVKRAGKIFHNRRENQILISEIRINVFEGSAQWVHCSSKLLLHSEDGTDIIAIVLTNITNRVNSEINMKYQLDRYRQIDEVSDDIQFNYELGEDRFTIPVKFGKFMSSDNVIKHFIAENKAKEFVHPEDYDIYIKQASQALDVGGKSTAEYRIRVREKEYSWCRVILNCVVDEQGTISYVYGRILVIDEEKRIQKEHKDDRMLINRLSSTDRLTGLYNRTAFRARVEEILKKDDMDAVHALVYMDINNFSFINEKYGYPAGDRLLREFSQMFLRKGKKCFGCRPHSDFFIVYVNDSDKRQVISKINNWAKLFSEHQTKTYPGIDIRISAGVYFIPFTQTDIAQAIDCANMARKQIKKNKLKNICIFTDSLKERRAYEQSIVGEISDAIKSDKIEVFLQPKFSISSREIIGAEALARWKNDDGTYKNAADFIPILEESGRITDLDFCVYTKVLQTLRKWKKLKKKAVPVSVNFSDRHNTYAGFDEKIYRLAEQYDVDFSSIEIEVKEKILSSNVDNICDKVENLQKKGFTITLDGFGYGGSSLGFLLNAPVNAVKVDKNIWKNISISEKEKNFVKALSDMISSVHKDVVFEGVETEEQAQLLSDSGFTKAQGYLFAEPMKVEEFEARYL
ncbi:MAG: EAL domain-containing protein [Lachnospiraceae bacterium]